MLDACAPGAIRTLRDHNWRVVWGPRTYPSFPRGEHGKTNPEIEVGHIRKMIRHLGIDMECAKRHLQILK